MLNKKSLISIHHSLPKHYITWLYIGSYKKDFPIITNVGLKTTQ